jgi:carbon storage regulator
MLVLDRRRDESIIITVGEQRIKVTVLGQYGNVVRVGVDAPEGVAVNREERQLAIEDEAAGIRPWTYEEAVGYVGAEVVSRTRNVPRRIESVNLLPGGQVFVTLRDNRGNVFGVPVERIRGWKLRATGERCATMMPHIQPAAAE